MWMRFPHPGECSGNEWKAMKVEHSIQIETPLDVVWDVTLDVERWPSWTPTMESLHRVDEGPFGVGSSVRIKQPGQPESIWAVTEFEPLARFAWETRRPGLRMVASHVLQQEGDGTANLLRLEVSGILGVLLWPVLKGMVRKALSQENQGLKSHCEELHASKARV